MKRKTTDKEELLEEARFEIDRNAFKGPFTCCGMKTKKVGKRASYMGLEVGYETWKCGKCGKEYLETSQSKKLQKIWTLEALFEGKGIKVERSLNYDGKTYFVRFPKDLTGAWKKKRKASITMITPEKFMVEIG